jgi:hypothetical protein
MLQTLQSTITTVLATSGIYNTAEMKLIAEYSCFALEAIEENEEEELDACIDVLLFTQRNAMKRHLVSIL